MISSRIGSCESVFGPVVCGCSVCYHTWASDSLAMVDVHGIDGYFPDISGPGPLPEGGRVQWNMQMENDPAIDSCCVTTIGICGSSICVGDSHFTTDPKGYFKNHLCRCTIASSLSGLKPPKVVKA
jgi:hypothetical protein